jgi:hypothetical protein
MVAILPWRDGTLTRMRPAAFTHVKADLKQGRSLRWGKGGTLRLSRP